MKEQVRLESLQKKINNEVELMRKVQEVPANKGDDPASWNVSDLRVLVSWFKCPTDSKIPATRALLLACYELNKNCVETDRSNLKHGEQAVVDNANGGGGGNSGDGGCDCPDVGRCHTEMKIPDGKVDLMDQ